MKDIVEKEFASYVLRYVGVGLISGSLVHAGTLGGDVTRYIVLVILGIISFIIGTLLEKRKESITVQFIAVSVALSLGVGMISGGTQHYLDGPRFASFLISVGLLLGYTMFLVREGKVTYFVKKTTKATVLSLLLFTILFTVSHVVHTKPHHHIEEGE